MKKITDYTNFMEHQSDCVLRLLLEWQPSAAGLSEKAYEQELQTWLSSKLPEVPIVAQYGIAKGKADLVIDDTYIIELKLAFTDETLVEFDRCIGQLERYRQKWVDNERGRVYLVIVGKSDSEFRNMIHKAFERFNQPYVLGNYFLLIEKYS
jgi:hypothetical protein